MEKFTVLLQRNLNGRVVILFAAKETGTLQSRTIYLLTTMSVRATVLCERDTSASDPTSHRSVINTLTTKRA